MGSKLFILLVLAVFGANASQRFVTYDVPFKPKVSDEVKARQNLDCQSHLTPELIAEIQSHQAVADQIMDYVINNAAFKGRTMKELADLVDQFPIRMSGEQNLELAITYSLERMEALGLEHVRGEQVLVPHWVRGEEKAELLAPWKKPIRILGLGTTVGTPEEGLTGDVLVVKSFDELDARQAEVPGKIVVFNQGWIDYGHGYQYRNQGASRAAQYGAIASLIRSVAPFSLDTPHTGGQTYAAGATKHIPTACITVEDADLLQRLQDKGQTIQIFLKMLDYNLPLTTSRNAIGELPGHEKPYEYVAVSGHIDSWDLGQGVMDDAGGVMISIMALAALKELNLTPRRTLQAILWTSEEPGLWGVEDFGRQHENILSNYSVFFESDSGTFDPLGLDFYGHPKAGCIVNEVLKLMAPINTTQFFNSPSPVSSDISELQRKGVNGLSYANKNDMYFWYHHTEADTITMANTNELDRGVALWAVSSYVIANLQDKLDAPPPLP